MMIREDVFLKSVRQMLCEPTDGDGKQKTIIPLEATGTIAKANRSDNGDGFCNHHRCNDFRVLPFCDPASHGAGKLDCRS